MHIENLYSTNPNIYSSTFIVYFDRLPTVFCKFYPFTFTYSVNFTTIVTKDGWTRSCPSASVYFRKGIKLWTHSCMQRNVWCVYCVLLYICLFPVHSYLRFKIFSVPFVMIDGRKDEELSFSSFIIHTQTQTHTHESFPWKVFPQNKLK